MSVVPSTLVSRRQRRRAIGAALSGNLAGCPLCAGRGRYPTAWKSLRACPGCAGSGLVAAGLAEGMGVEPCGGCGGSGAAAGSAEACPECRGFGVVVVAAGGSPRSAGSRRDAA